MERRKPSWSLWCAAVLIGLPALYVAILGPACCLAALLPEPAAHALAVVYAPLFSVVRSDYCPSWVGEVIIGYAQYCVLLAGPER